MKCTRYKIVAIILATIAVGLLIGSFFMPPQGKIDGSVLSGVGEIIGIIAILFAWEAVDLGIDAKVTHGNTTIELNNPDKKDE